MKRQILSLMVVLASTFGFASAQGVESSGAASVNSAGFDSFASPSRWYVGAGGGVSFIQSTFESFNSEGVNLGYNGRVMAGYKLNYTFAVEASLSYMMTESLTSECCSGYYLWDGKRYFAPLAGLDIPQYSELISNSDIYQLGVHLPIDFFGRSSQFSRVGFLIIPSLYAAYIDAEISYKDSGLAVATQVDNPDVVFGAGVDVALSFRLSKRVQARLQTGLNAFAGSVDGMPYDEHPIGYVWNSSLNIVVKL
ncbi:MAG: hypothetical protein SNH88_00340 [Rikenellaceae bacterium]